MAERTDEEERLRIFDELAQHTALVAADVEESRFVVGTSDGVVGRGLFARRNRGEFGLLERTMSVLSALKLADDVSHGTFLDAGANIGTTTVAALRRHGFAFAVACEPEPSNARLLRANLALNDVADRARVIPVALSDKPGPIELLVHPRNSGGHRVIAAPGRSTKESELEAITVEATTLDVLADAGLVNPADLALLWMDVQGHEAQVLAGGSRLLAAVTAPAVLELHPGLLRQAGDGPEGLHDMVSEYYTHFVELRRTKASLFSDVLQPVSELPALAESVDDRGGHTDVLFVRLRVANLRAWAKRTMPDD